MEGPDLSSHIRDTPAAENQNAALDEREKLRPEDEESGSGDNKAIHRRNFCRTLVYKYVFN